MPNPLTTRAAILQGLRDGPAYGMDLIRRLARMTDGRVRLAAARVYPVLKALKATGVVEGWEVVPRRCRGGRSRSYYELTRKGVSVASAERAALTSIVKDRQRSARPTQRQRRLMANRLQQGDELFAFVREMKAGKRSP